MLSKYIDCEDYFGSKMTSESTLILSVCLSGLVLAYFYYYFMLKENFADHLIHGWPAKFTKLMETAEKEEHRWHLWLGQLHLLHHATTHPPHTIIAAKGSVCVEPLVPFLYQTYLLEL